MTIECKDAIFLYYFNGKLMFIRRRQPLNEMQIFLLVTGHYLEGNRKIYPILQSLRYLPLLISPELTFDVRMTLKNYIFSFTFDSPVIGCCYTHKYTGLLHDESFIGHTDHQLKTGIEKIFNRLIQKDQELQRDLLSDEIFDSQDNLAGEVIDIVNQTTSLL